MKLYHGSTEIIQHPAPEKGRKNNDWRRAMSTIKKILKQGQYCPVNDCKSIKHSHF